MIGHCNTSSYSLVICSGALLCLFDNYIESVVLGEGWCFRGRSLLCMAVISAHGPCFHKSEYFKYVCLKRKGKVRENEIYDMHAMRRKQEFPD